jgi:hypothetical protein
MQARRLHDSRSGDRRYRLGYRMQKRQTPARQPVWRPALPSGVPGDQSEVRHEPGARRVWRPALLGRLKRRGVR